MIRYGTFGSNIRPPLPPGMKLDENVYVTMRDGIKIAVDVYRPEAEGRYPALLSTSPYIKEIQQLPPEYTHSIEAGATNFFVNRGYVHVIEQVRGTGYSQGRYNWYDSTEAKDGYEIVEWIAKQPWCNGNVGMMGDSYFGRTQFLIAGEKPPHLKCIAPFDAGSDDYRDSRNEGGLLRAGWIEKWGIDTMRQALLWPGPIEGKLPPADLITDRSLHPDDGPYYWERSGYRKVDSIEVPVMNIAINMSKTHSRGQLWIHERLKVPKKLVVAPSCRIANVFLIRSKAINELLLKWYDHWLKGIDNSIMDEPPVAIFDNATKQWRYENEYPLKRTKWTEFHLHTSTENPASDAPWGLLSEEKSVNEKPDQILIPECLSRIAAEKPVLAYATKPLTKDITLWGPLSFTFYASTTAYDMAWFVRLGEVSPDGKVSLFTQNLLKASYHEVDKSQSRPGQPWHTFQNPVPPEPEKVYEYQIEITPIFHTFKKGSKIWIQIANDDFEYQTSLRTIYNAETLPLPVTNMVYHDSRYPSHLLLPVIPDAPIIKPVEPPISQIKFPLGEDDIVYDLGDKEWLEKRHWQGARLDK